LHPRHIYAIDQLLPPIERPSLVPREGGVFGVGLDNHRPNLTDLLLLPSEVKLSGFSLELVIPGEPLPVIP